jgi:5-methylcytosine-specific restriction endonuclease McrA
MSRADLVPIDVAERVLRVLEEGSFTATYKQAVLVALLDLCLESTERDGVPRDTLTTRQVAEKVLGLYWPHTRVWGAQRAGRILVQNSAGARANVERGGGVVAKIRLFREEIEQLAPGTASLAAARAQRREAYDRLLDEVEWTLIEMPLPKLQRVGGRNAEWLYRIAWRDADEREPAHRGKALPTRASVRAYQRHAPSDFDNRIHLQPGVASAFARLHALLRPFILRHWTAKVVDLNGLAVDDVSAFLFGSEREDTGPVRRPLVALQRGRCFYCDAKLTGDVHVDHFIPWARHPDNALHNLVAADAGCNGAKKDYLASVAHVARWRRRALDEVDALEAIAHEARWDAGGSRILGAARGIYLALPEEMPLWSRGREFEQGDPRALRRALAA